MRSLSLTVSLALLVGLHVPHASAQPSASELLARATAILAPEEFAAELTFTTRRANGDLKTFSIKMWKQGVDRMRFKFVAPVDDRDMEVLRVGDDIWNYLPNLKRAVRVSPKQEFHGGDFANADVLRLDLAQDYTVTLGTADRPDERLLLLTAKNDQVAYHRVKYWLRATDAMPLRQEFYAASGKLLRTLTFEEPKRFGKLIRPSKYVMRNMLVKARSTEMVWDSLRVAKLDGDRFVHASLGR